MSSDDVSVLAFLAYFILLAIAVILIFIDHRLGHIARLLEIANRRRQPPPDYGDD